MIALDEIKDFDALKYEAVLMSLELQYSRRRLKEQAEEIARLKGQQPAEQLELELVKKTEQLARLRHKVFGDSTERRPGPNPPGDEKPAAAARGHGPTPQPRLPKREEHHRLADDERHCPACQGTLEEMGEQTEDAEEVTVEKRRFVVVTHRRHKYRCRCNGAVKTAPGPLRLLPGGRYSPDFAIASRSTSGSAISRSIASAGRWSARASSSRRRRCGTRRMRSRRCSNPATWRCCNTSWAPT